MIVKELIEKLKKQDPNSIVLTSWYEEWREAIDTVSLVYAQKDNTDTETTEKTWYRWEYSDYKKDDWYEKIKAIFIW